MSFPTPPAFDDALQNSALDGTPFRVYRYLTHILDFVSWRPVKLSEIESGAHCHERSAAWALARLIELGYVERGEKRDRVWTYRLVWSRVLVAKAG